eukprot:5396752-Pleurochrysis_carterae.AAC.3
MPTDPSCRPLSSSPTRAPRACRRTQRAPSHTSQGCAQSGSSRKEQQDQPQQAHEHVRCAALLKSGSHM